MIERFQGFDRELHRKQAEETRRNKIEYAQKHLKTDWMDQSYWQKLSSKYEIRLPQWYAPNSETKHVKRLFKKLDTDLQEYLESCGCTSLKQLVDLHPSYPAYVEVCFALEWYDEKYGVGYCSQLD